MCRRKIKKNAKKQSENSVLNPRQYCEIEVITDEIAEYLQTLVEKKIDNHSKTSVTKTLF